MQTLYSMESATDSALGADAKSILNQKIEQSRKLFSYLVYFLCEVAHYSQKDAVQRAGKHLPSAEDLSVNTKISGNEVTRFFEQDEGFLAFVKKDHPENNIDAELIKKPTRNFWLRRSIKNIPQRMHGTKSRKKRYWNLFLTSLCFPTNILLRILKNIF